MLRSLAVDGPQALRSRSMVDRWSTARGHRVRGRSRWLVDGVGVALGVAGAATRHCLHKALICLSNLLFADARFAHVVGGNPTPISPPTGPGNARHALSNSAGWNPKAVIFQAIRLRALGIASRGTAVRRGSRPLPHTPNHHRANGDKPSDQFSKAKSQGNRCF